MRIRLRRSALAGMAGLLAFPFATVQACAPGFQPDTFVRTTRPDDIQAFAAGRLGILQTGYDSNELAVAFRYLNGGVLSKEEQSQYAPPPQPVKDWTKITSEQTQAAQAAENAAQPVSLWLATRNGLALPIAPSDARAAGLPDPQDWYSPAAVNCPDPAFRTAVLTLKRRVDTWGKQSPWVTDWVHAQDVVFSNCNGQKSGLPQAAPQGAPALLRADRTYQSAAAAFYSRKYDEARDGFEAVARDSDSPWQAWGRYLAARAVVRKAFAMGNPSEDFSLDLAQFDMPTMRQAQLMLETLLAHPPTGLPPDAVQAELQFVRMRTEPDKRAAEVCAALAGPRPDPRLKQDLDDLNFLLVKHVKLASAPPLLEWVDAVRHGSGDASIAHWKGAQTIPWLVVAMMQADSKAPGTPDLLAAAAKVQARDPAYATLAFHRARILAELGRGAEARTLVDSMLKAKREAASSDRNAFLGQRMKLARSFDEFLEYAPRTVLDANSQGFFDAGGICGSFQDFAAKPRNCVQDEHLPTFADDSVDVLNQQTPLSRLVEAAQSSRLPKWLRDELAMAAWTRSVVLDDADSAAKLAPLIPERLRKTAGTGIGFSATLALLRNPGLRPVVEAGFSRFRSYDALDDFRDNWWCGGWQAQGSNPNGAQKPDKVPYLSDWEQTRGEAEYRRVMDLPCAPTYMGRKVIDYAKAHPDDPDVPEALALTVRATRYACLRWGGNTEESAGKENSATSKAAFQLLHANYSKSLWTAKTKYYY